MNLRSIDVGDEGIPTNAEEESEDAREEIIPDQQSVLKYYLVILQNAPLEQAYLSYKTAPLLRDGWELTTCVCECATFQQSGGV